MQTFLPYPDFVKTFQCLDYKRLGKQRLEARQIFNIITGRAKSNAWTNHPAVLMWKGHADALALYHNLCIDEWVRRGYKNSMEKINIKYELLYPFWFSMEKFHSSHRQTLLFKNYDYYKQFGWKETPKYEYYWPVRISK